MLHLRFTAGWQCGPARLVLDSLNCVDFFCVHILEVHTFIIPEFLWTLPVDSYSYEFSFP